MKPNEPEKEKIVREWFEKAFSDLESAEILLRESSHYDIVVYHAHQAIEKYFKATLLKANKTFRFVHDLNSFFSEASELLPIKQLEEDVSFVNSLYPRLRYPSGDIVTLEEAEKSLAIAKKILGPSAR